MYVSGTLTKFIIFVFIFLSACSSANTQTNKVRRFDDVVFEQYGSNDCRPFSPKLPDFRAPGRRISEVKCFEYVWRAKKGMESFKHLIQCQRQQNYFPVLGGRTAKIGEYAHMGALGWIGLTGNWIFKCGATLISEYFALTAAHCSKLRKTDTDVADHVPRIVRLGADTIENESKDNKPTDVIIRQIVTHPQYNPPRQYYDIALLQFRNEVKFEWTVHPACLENTFELPKKATVSGWGVIDLATQQSSPTLQVAELSLIDSQTCDNLLYSKRNRNWRGVSHDQVCAGHLAGGIDSCQGDSGGPLSYMIANERYKNDNSRWTVHRVVGVTSFGSGCGRANVPGIYTRVAYFADWIESIVWPQYHK